MRSEGPQHITVHGRDEVVIGDYRLARVSVLIPWMDAAP
jgi:hypothetical protein